MTHPSRSLSGRIRVGVCWRSAARDRPAARRADRRRSRRLSRQPVRNRTDAMRVLLQGSLRSWSRLGRCIDRPVMGCVAAGAPPALDLKREQLSPQQHWHGCGQRGVMPASKKTFSQAKYLVDAQGSEGVRVQTVPESGPTKLAQPKWRLGRGFSPPLAAARRRRARKSTDPPPQIAADLSDFHWDSVSLHVSPEKDGKSDPDRTLPRPTCLARCLRCGAPPLRVT